jgi:hypothetical protein
MTIELLRVSLKVKVDIIVQITMSP